MKHMLWLSSNAERLELFIDYAIRDLLRGKGILIPTLFKSMCDILICEINERFGSKITDSFGTGLGKDHYKRYTIALSVVKQELL